MTILNFWLFSPPVPKAIRRYKQLLLRRIKSDALEEDTGGAGQGEDAPQDGSGGGKAARDIEVDNDDDDEDDEDGGDKKWCSLVWEVRWRAERWRWRLRL